MEFYKDKTYIEMCVKADLIPLFAIQTIGYLRPGIVWQDGNCFYNRFSIDMPSNNDKLIWIPRQDQLQGMFNNPSSPLLIIGQMWHLTTEIVTEYYHLYGSDLETVEQILLAIVMKHKHNKTWNGEDWI